MKEQLISRWYAFTNKEQSILIALLFIIICAFFYAFVWQPIQHNRERLSRIIPEKKEDIYLMRSQAAEIERLRGQFNKIRTHVGGLKAAIEASAKVNGLTLNYGPTANNDDKRLFKVSLNRVSFDAWIKWVELLQSQYMVHIQSCKVTPSSVPGQVDIDVVFIAMEKV